MPVVFYYSNHIREQYAKANVIWKTAKVTLATRGLVNQILKDTRHFMMEGDWAVAVKTANYVHEVAKLSGFYHWYDYFLAVKRDADRVAKMVEEAKRERR
jgi:hypothetical protein